MMMMAEYRIDPKRQFSKRLARWTAVFWFVYMTWISVIMLLQPGTAQFVFYMSIVVSVVMIVNVAAYTTNSVQEKILFAMLNKTQMEINIGTKGSGKHEEMTGEGGNG